MNILLLWPTLLSLVWQLETGDKIWLHAKLKNEDKQILTNPKGDENTRMKARRLMK